MFREFKEFAVKGNMIDLAVGVIVGAAFGKVVTSLVEDMLMPVVSLIGGKVDMTNKFVPLVPEAAKATLEEAKKAGSVLAWGSFVTNAINFIIVAFAVFILVKAINKVRRAEAEIPADPPAPSTEEKLLTEIRDALVTKP